MPDLSATYPLPRYHSRMARPRRRAHRSVRRSPRCAEFNTYSSSLSKSAMQFSAAQDVAVIVQRALAKAELKAPATVQGSFIPAGNALDAMAAIGKILGGATQDVLIVDPYMDEKVLTNFAPLAPEHVAIRLLPRQRETDASPRCGTMGNSIWDEPSFNGETGTRQNIARSVDHDRRRHRLGAHSIAKCVRHSIASVDRAS